MMRERAGAFKWSSYQLTPPAHFMSGMAECRNRRFTQPIVGGHRLAGPQEFYYNDAGQQINNLALSVQARAQGETPDDPGWPKDGYQGSYIEDVARAFAAGRQLRPRTGSSPVRAILRISTQSGILPWPVCDGSKIRTSAPFR